ncbi:NAD(P)H-dependent oxidoreductase subunit E [candidate division WOR-3 bacterium]|nr:NAD(P)H-dependent oxidoreductase subunit E [candidate division WOR-3 bacterium]
MKKVENILHKYGYQMSHIIQILQDVQVEFNYLPKEALEYVSQRLKMPMSKIYSIATFYAGFSLNPRGKHLCTVCMGTACHVRGAANVLDRIEERLGIKSGATTPDKLFTLETVNCLGACALAPIVVIDGEYHGQTTVNKVDVVINKYEKKGS